MVAFSITFSEEFERQGRTRGNAQALKITEDKFHCIPLKSTRSFILEVFSDSKQQIPYELEFAI